MCYFYRTFLCMIHRTFVRGPAFSAFGTQGRTAAVQVSEKYAKLNQSLQNQAEVNLNYLQLKAVFSIAPEPRSILIKYGLNFGFLPSLHKLAGGRTDTTDHLKHIKKMKYFCIFLIDLLKGFLLLKKRIVQMVFIVKICVFTMRVLLVFCLVAEKKVKGK